MALEEQLQEWRDNALGLEENVAKAVIGQGGHHPAYHGCAVCPRSRTAGGRCWGGQDDGPAGLFPGDRRRIRARGRHHRHDAGDLVYHTYVDADGKPRIDPGPLLRHGERLTTFFFNEINRARPQVQSLLLRAMAERSVSAFDREYRFPHMIVFADRNKVEREETFELASAARDRFLFELNMPTPTDVDVRRALVFDPEYHDVDKLLERVSPGLVAWEQLNGIGGLIQRNVSASATIERYVLDIWRATERPQTVRHRARRRRHAAADPGRCESARHERGSRGLLAWSRGSRAAPTSFPRTCMRSCCQRSAIACSSHRSTSCGARSLRRRSPPRSWRRLRCPEPMNALPEFHYRLPGRASGFRPGSHSGSSFGAGQEFAMHGRLFDHPDPRRIDLRASMRAIPEEWLVRVNLQRVAVPLHVVVDVSASMHFGRRQPKLSLAADFVAALGYSAFRAGDQVGMLAFDAAEREDLYSPARYGQGVGDVIAGLLRTCAQDEEGVAGGIDGLERSASKLAGKQGLVFLVSDFSLAAHALAHGARYLDSRLRHTDGDLGSRGNRTARRWSAAVRERCRDRRAPHLVECAARPARSGARPSPNDGRRSPASSASAARGRFFVQGPSTRTPCRAISWRRPYEARRRSDTFGAGLDSRCRLPPSPPRSMSRGRSAM